MAPGAKVLAAELVKAADQLWFSADRGLLSVNHVRSLVEKKLKLEEGFFKQGEWKTRSRDVITNQVNQLEATSQDGNAVSSQVQAESQNGKKRSPPQDATPATKRQKRVTAAKTDDAAGGADSKDSPAKPIKAAPKKPHAVTKNTKKTEKKAPKKATKKAPKRKRNVHSSDEEDEDEDDEEEEEEEEEEDDEEEDFSDESEPASAKKRAPPKMTRRAPAKTPQKKGSAPEEGEDEEDEEPEPADEIQASPVAFKPTKAPTPAHTSATDGPKKKTVASDADSPLSELGDDDSESKEEQKAAAEKDTSSELSELEDDSPNPKSKQRTSSTKEKQPKAAAGTNSDEAEAKRLQGQLVRCGVRKIWGVELKKYGDNSRAKIRHLQGMLREIGMVGRFSGAKAREIKERRELEADLAAVTEMNKAWGLGRESGRASRSRGAGPKTKSYAGDDDDDEAEEDGEEKAHRKRAGKAAEDDGESEAEDATRGRGRGSAKYRADLAFLGDESESD